MSISKQRWMSVSQHLIDTLENRYKTQVISLFQDALFICFRQAKCWLGYLSSLLPLHSPLLPHSLLNFLLPVQQNQPHPFQGRCLKYCVQMGYKDIALGSDLAYYFQFILWNSLALERTISLLIKWLLCMVSFCTSIISQHRAVPEIPCFCTPVHKPFCQPS